MMDFSKMIIPPEASVREALRVLDQSAKGIALVCDERRHLLGTLTDGDLRRAVLAGFDLTRDVRALLAVKHQAYASPITVPQGTPHEEMRRLMVERSIRHLPVVNSENQVVELMTLPELVSEEWRPPQAVIMAGGRGSRLRPLTDDTPKPMLPVGGKPLMEWIVDQLRGSGIHQIKVSTHFKAEKIQDHFGEGESFGVKIDYVEEAQPLGTAGALGNLKNLHEPILVMNGDILTKVNFRTLVDFHREHQSDLTVGVRQYDFQVPYGVLSCDGVRVTGIEEKPVVNFLVNAGIYCLEPTVYRFIADGERMDMPDLIRCALEAGLRVVSFPIVEYWMDIGQMCDYEQVQQDINSGRVS